MDNKFHGFGFLKDKFDIKYKGNFKDGKRHGIFKSIYPAGMVTKDLFENDVIVKKLEEIKEK